MNDSEDTTQTRYGQLMVRVVFHVHHNSILSRKKQNLKKPEMGFVGI